MSKKLLTVTTVAALLFSSRILRAEEFKSPELNGVWQSTPGAQVSASTTYRDGTKSHGKMSVDQINTLMNELLESPLGPLLIQPMSPDGVEKDAFRRFLDALPSGEIQIETRSREIGLRTLLSSVMTTVSPATKTLPTPVFFRTDSAAPSTPRWISRIPLDRIQHEVADGQRHPVFKTIRSSMMGCRLTLSAVLSLSANEKDLQAGQLHWNARLMDRTRGAACGAILTQMSLFAEEEHLASVLKTLSKAEALDTKRLDRVQEVELTLPLEMTSLSR